MRLPEFISQNLEAIMADWVAFAGRSGTGGEHLDVAQLRDHAKLMLREIVDDLRTPQTDSEQMAKGKGNAPALKVGAAATAAADHGAGRAESGFTVGEMTAEFRALRASVTRLWTQAKGRKLDAHDLHDLIRFNEMIDQLLAESVTQFSADIDRAREIFLSILGDDLRRPLAAVTTATHRSLQAGDLAEPHRGVMAQAHGTAQRMTRMVDDLLDFTEGRLGTGIPITRASVDLGRLMRDVVNEMCSAEPECSLQFTGSGDLVGEWDAARVTQMVTNLIDNAFLHGAARSLIGITAQGEPAEVVLRVHNFGKPIPEADLPGLFSPYRRFHAEDAALRDSGGIGLGLYIAERIIAAHGGSIDVRSSEAAGTLFTVRLPRAAGQLDANAGLAARRP